jgi:homoserine dehydrogenase
VDVRAFEAFDMTTVADAVRAEPHALVFSPDAPARITLLGVGQVGGALAALARTPQVARRFRVTSGLVRDTARERPNAADVPLTSNLRHAIGSDTDIVVEALGGLEPARTLVLEALERRIPVVTANKSLLAAHGDALLDAAADAGVSLRYEAAVLAGVPFLGTFARRSLARDVTGLCGIVNGTTNFVLSRMADERSGFASALAEAQARGYAEPDPSNDVRGVDAAEKLCVLVRHFGDWSISPSALETLGIEDITADDIAAAEDLGGVLKPAVFADWRAGELSAFAGPAFLSASHPLARVDGVRNAVLLSGRSSGELLFAGPGAGPDVTAATLLDDAEEIADDAAGRAGASAGRCRRTWKRAAPLSPVTGWFVRVAGDELSDAAAIADRLSSHGVTVRRTLERDGLRTRRWFLTGGCAHARITNALRALSSAAGCRAASIRVLEK